MKTLLQILLFSLAPFFIYPWKPVINVIAGESYSVALKHFKKGHYGTVNLAGHFVCLISTILGNFGLLALLDERLEESYAKRRILSTFCAIVWCGVLVLTEAPRCISFFAFVLIAFAYASAPNIQKETLEQCFVIGFILAILVSNYFTNKREKIKLPWISWVPKLLLVPGLYILSWMLSQSPYARSQTENSARIEIALLLLMTIISATPNPIKKVVVLGTILCRSAYIVTGVDELFYLSLGFVSSLYQGITHLITQEEATLITHGKKGGDNELALEYAHVVYFPNLTLETIYCKALNIAE